MKRYDKFYEYIVDKKKTNLKKEYDKYNKLIWNNQLPEVPLKWNKSKTSGGKVVSFGYKNDPSSWVIENLQISLFTENDYESFSGILVHEMIHVYLISNRMTDKTMHGRNFMKEVNRINSMNLGFTVPLTDEIMNKKVSSNNNVEYLVVLIKTKSTGKYSIQVYNRKLYPTVVANFFKYPQGWLSQYEISFIYSSNPELSKYPIKRGWSKKFSAYEVKDEVLEDVLSNGKEIAVWS